MKRSTKKGFTIVELVIVIAIIAILAAVLIPTFASLIQKANESKDTQLVKNLNTALAADNKEHKTMQDALDAAVEFGYDVGKINASATNKEILWDSKNDVFCYYDTNTKTPEYIPETSLKNGAVAENETYKLWKIYTEAPTEQTFSIYWNSDKAFDKELTVGFDAGNNTAITALNYVGNGETQEVIIRTNGGTLTVNADKATVNHYEKADKVVIIAVDGNSFHEFGKVNGDVVVTKGHVVIESGATVGTIKVADEATANSVKLSNNSNEAIVIIDADNKISSDSTIGQNSVKVTEKEAVALIGSTSYKTIKEALEAAQDGDTVKLIADYRMTAENTADTVEARLTIKSKITFDFGDYRIICFTEMENYGINFVALFVAADATFIAGENGGIIADEVADGGPYGVNIINGATLTIKSGTYLGGGTAVQVQKGTLEILGGKFIAHPYSNPQYGYKFVINAIDSAFKDGSAKISIKGGTFYKFDPSDSQSENPRGSFTDEGYTVNRVDDWYTVVPQK